MFFFPSSSVARFTHSLIHTHTYSHLLSGSAGQLRDAEQETAADSYIIYLREYIFLLLSLLLLLLFFFYFYKETDTCKKDAACILKDLFIP